MGEDFSRQTRRFSAAILTYDKGNRRSMAGKRPARRRSTVVNTGSYIGHHVLSEIFSLLPFVLFHAYWGFFHQNAQMGVNHSSYADSIQNISSSTVPEWLHSLHSLAHDL